MILATHGIVSSQIVTVPVAIAATGVGSTSFTANWNAYTGATYYLLDVSTSSSFSTFVYQNQLTTSTSYVVVGLQPNTTYYYRVRASDGDADYQAVLNYATAQGYTLPSSSQQLLQEQLLKDLKSGGIWSKLDTFAVFATDGNSDFALIDWKRLSQYTAVNSPTFTTNGGFTGNGTSSYIDTNFNPSVGTNKYLLNNAGRFFWVDNRTGTTWEGTSTGATNNSVNQDSASIRINQGTANLNSIVSFAVDEFHAINRTSSTNVEIFTNTTQSSRTATSTSIANVNQFVLRGGNTYNGSRFKMYAMGQSLVSENTSFYNAVNTYLTSL
jgi:hypothetical protein